MPETLHLVATTVGEVGPNNVWHTIRFLNGTWLRFGDVEAQAGGDRGFFQDVDCNQVRLDLHVCGVTRDLRLWHTVRRMDGSWVAFGDVEGQAGDRGNLISVACTSTYNSTQPHDLAYELQVLAPNSAGRLWHTIRRADGSWTQFGDVEGQAGDRGSFRRVAVATRPTNFPEGVPQEYETHVCGVTSDGHLWHTIRNNNGAWTQFGDVEGQAGDRGAFFSVDCAVADTGNESLVLHVAGVADNSRLWHTIRSNNGSWTQFGNVANQAGDMGLFAQPSLARVLM